MMDDEWENEGGTVLPYIDDNSSREEVDNWKKGIIDKPIVLPHNINFNAKQKNTLWKKLCKIIKQK